MMQVTQVNWKLLEKQLYRNQYAQNYVFTIFLQTIHMTIQPLKIAAKNFFISRTINLNIQNLKIIPYNQKKMQIQHGALFLRFSINFRASSL